MENIFRDAQAELYVRGDVIEAIDKVYFIKTGVVGLYSLGETSNFIFAFRAGDIFPYVKKVGNFSLKKGVKYMAMDNLVLLSLSVADYERQAFSEHYAKETFHNLVETLEYIFDRIDNLAQVSAYKRLLYRLNFIAERLGTTNGDKVVIAFPVTNADMAAAINTSRETVNRLMKQLERSSVITIKKQTIIVNSRKNLENLLAAEYDKVQPKAQRFNSLVLAGLAAEGAMAAANHIGNIPNL